MVASGGNTALLKIIHCYGNYLHNLLLLGVSKSRNNGISGFYVKAFSLQKAILSISLHYMQLASVIFAP